MTFDSVPLFYCRYLSSEFKITDVISMGLAYAYKQKFSACK